MFIFSSFLATGNLIQVIVTNTLAKEPNSKILQILQGLGQNQSFKNKLHVDLHVLFLEKNTKIQLSLHT